MDEAESLEALSNLLTELSSNPYDISLHAQHIQLATAAGMEDQVHAARQMLTSFWPAGDELWVPMLEAKEKEGVDTAEKIWEVLAVFDMAEADYLSIPLLQRHLAFVIERHAHFASVDSKPKELAELFTTEWTRAMIASIVEKGIGHLTQGQKLWNVQRDWEMERLEVAEAEEREILIALIDDFHLTRLRQPHSAHDETLQSYSTFTTAYRPAASYESLLVSAAKVKAQATKSWDRRERLEASLVSSNYSPESYAYYIAYERRARQPDLFVMKTLYERAIADTAQLRFKGDAGAEIALRSFWVGLCDVLRIHAVSYNEELALLKRATRSVPGSGEVWARYIRFLERLSVAGESFEISSGEDVTAAFERALATGLIQRDVEQVVPIVLGRAGYDYRSIRNASKEDGSSLPDNALASLIKVLDDGILMVRQASKEGDRRFRLEKFLARIYQDMDMADDAMSVWEAAAKHYRSSYLAWTYYTDILVKEGKFRLAHDIFKDIYTKNLDWPEAIFEAWISFEHGHGDVETIEECLDKIERAQAQLNARRAKEAEKAAYQAAQISEEIHAASIPVVEAQEQLNNGSASMDVDAPTQAEESKKRKAADSGGTEGNKKAKTDIADPPKRDRENCTVFIASLPEEVTKDDLKGLFKDCGSIKEIKITKLPNSLVATVEFTERDSVPGALTKDKKRLNGHEVAVHLAWRSTLYVTNFPEKADDEFIRKLFETFGTIFDVRWPSKKYKNTRRFCYVQFTSPDSAEAALSLNTRELEPGQPMNVYISNPERKKERTDASANDREVYIAGLSKFTTKEDLEKLFKTFGVIKDVRMALDDAGHPKGFAFIEYGDEHSAQKALQANNLELKNRRIAVTLADTRVRARLGNVPTSSGKGHRADVRSRTVRIKNLPPETQEGLLQQVLEKLVPVKRVEVLEAVREAIAELQTTADAGRLLLHPEPIQFNGTILKLSEERPEGASKSLAVAPPTSGMFIPRAAVSRPRVSLGGSKRLGKMSTEKGGLGASDTCSGGKEQDDFRKMLG